MSKSIYSEEQRYQMIMECRSSGLTDYQWCKNHDIRPGTFYSWVNHLRKKGYAIKERSYEVPNSPSQKQEVVKLQPEQMVAPIMDRDMHEVYATSVVGQESNLAMEFEFPGFKLSVTNNINPNLLELTLRCLGGMSC